MNARPEPGRSDEAPGSYGADTARERTDIGLRPSRKVKAMDRRIRDRLQLAGASDEYIMSRMAEVSIHMPTEEDRRKGQSRRRFLAGREGYIEEGFAYLRTVARCLEMEEPSLISIQHSVDMVILHWL